MKNNNVKQADELLHKILMNVANDYANSVNPELDGTLYTGPDLESAKSQIKQALLLDLLELVGEDDKWDKKYPLSIKQDIKSRNHLRFELREAIRDYCGGEK